VKHAVIDRGFSATMRSALLRLVLVVLVPSLLMQAAIYTVWYHTRLAEEERVSLATSQPASDTLADVHLGLWIAGGLNLLVAVASAALAMKTSGNLIGQVRNLRAHAQAIERGDVGHSTETTGVRELAELATAFNQMGAAVHAAQEAQEAANATLEQRVRERTAELAATIQRLEQTEQERRSALLYARGLIEASLDPLVTISPEGKVTDVNKATESATGAPRTQLIGSDFSDYFTAPELARDGYRQVLSEGLVRNYPLTIRHVSGPTTDVLYNAVVYRNEAGEVQGVFAAARDVTERRRIELELSKYRAHLEELVTERTEQLETTNRQLETEVAERKRATELLEKARDELETRVQQRTVELSNTTEALRAERKRFQDVLDSLPAYVVLLTPDYHVSFANRYFRERFGESEGRRCFEYLFGRSEPCEVCDTYTVLKTKRPHRWEWTGPDGRNYDISDFPFTETDGSNLILEMGIDVTERKQAETELEKHRHHLEELVQQRTGQLEAANAQLQAVFDVVNVGMLLIDEQGVVKRVNNTVSRWVGRDVLDVHGGQPGDIIGCIHAVGDPAGCGQTPHCNTCPIRNAFNSVLLSGQPVHDVETATTLSVDGAEVGLWLEVSADPVVLNGKRHVILAMSNVTSRKRAEEAMERLASFPKLNPHPITEVDLEGRVQYLNPTAEQLFPDLQHSGLTHPWLADWESVAKAVGDGGTRVSVREVMVGAQCYQQTVHYVEDTQRVRLYGLEITERKQAEEALRHTADQLVRSNEELEQFAYVASHDLQEPLRVVNGYVQLIERKYKDRLDAEADEFIRYIIDGVTRMQQLITDLLNYSRVGTRGAPFRAASVEAVVGRAMANLKRVVEESAAVITRDPLPNVRGDETQLVQLFQNLIANGIKFHSDRSPHIHISARRDGDRWEFAVRDNGIGIERQYWEQIFVIFQRLHTRQKYAGTGIGLAICKRIVERHGGRIWLDSQPGQGTTFYFTLS
jgi:PAS domain S-box-containing protein